MCVYFSVLNLICTLSGNRDRRTGADKYQGNVYVAGLPVCDVLWNSEDAQVACSVLGYSKATTKAFPWTGNLNGYH